MANVKLSEINGGTPVTYAPSTDKFVGVRSGTTDELISLPSNLAVGPGTSTAHRLAAFANTDGQTLEDSGVLTSALALLAGAQTFTGAKTFTNSDILLLGSSTGATTFTSDNAGATNYTLHVPAANDTLAAIAAAQTLSNKTLTDPIETNTTRCTTQLNKTSSAALANIVGLVQTVVPGTYQYRIDLDTVSTVNGGVKAAFKFTTTVASALNCIAKAFDAVAVAVARFTTATDQASILASTTATVACSLVGTIVVTTGGTLQLQFAQNASHIDTSSVLVGSSMTFTRLA